MDTNNLKNIFGPYADKFIGKNQTTVLKSSVKSTARSQRKQVQQPIPASTNKALFTSSTSALRSNTKATSARQPPDWTSFHKKPNSNFALPIQAKLTSRMNQAEERRKTKRTEVVTGNRKIDVASLNLITPGPVTAKTGSRNETTIQNGNCNVSPAPPPVKGSRKEQLANWKKEKQALAKIEPQKKPPFKSGPALPILSRPLKQAIPPKTTDPKSIVPIERRVTRAMAKTHTIPLAPAAGANKSENTKLNAPSRDSRTAYVSNRKAPAPVQEKIKAKKVILQDTTRIPFEPVPEEEPMVVDEVEKSLAAAEETKTCSKALTPAVMPHGPGEGSQSQLQVQAVAEKPKTRKPKGMQFDKIYIEYNDKFIKACSLLLELRNKWTEEFSISREKISEDICCDIESTLGKAKLLMESKLPQFGELLYFYLSKHQDPGPILPGDLQGWWDVAIISVDKVTQSFQKLETIKKNDWVVEIQKEQEAPGSDPLSKRKPKNPIVPITGKAKQNAKPNSGLLAFLAEKKRKAAEGKEKMATNLEGRNDDDSRAQKSPSPDHRFEGGFFEIRSPKSTVTPKKLLGASQTPVRSSISRLSSALQANLQLTPGSANGSGSRRLSNPKTPLMMLAVRRSMGSICKLGVGAPLKENGNKEALASSFSSFPEEESNVVSN